MNKTNQDHTENEIKTKTLLAIQESKTYRLKFDRFNRDKNKVGRLLRHECKCCFYFDDFRMGGAAMTNWNCGICQKTEISGSTSTPLLCLDCSKNYELCSRCGGDIEMRTKRPCSLLLPKKEPK